MHFLFKIRDNISFISKNKVGTYGLQSFIQGLLNNEEKLIISQGLKFQEFYEMCLVKIHNLGLLWNSCCRKNYY